VLANGFAQSGQPSCKNDASPVRHNMQSPTPILVSHHHHRPFFKEFPGLKTSERFPRQDSGPQGNR
jgi:hypothetical protein